MAVTEHLMRPGSGSFNLVPATPLSITKTIADYLNGIGCEVVITATRPNVRAISDAAVLAQAIYAGRIVAKMDRTTYEFSGLGTWLDSYNDAAITRTAGTPTQWLGDLLINDLSTGSVSGGSNVSRTFPAYAQTHREALDTVAALGGWEYEIQPDGTVDAGTSVFSTTPSVVITDDSAGPDPTYHGLQGGILSTGVDTSPIATKVAVLGAGEGQAVTVATDTQAVSLKARGGSTPELVTILSAPSEPSTNVSALASGFLAMQIAQPSISVSTASPATRRYLRAGDYVYVYSLKGGIYDTANQIRFRGETITPAKLRCTSITWPIERGSGVFIRGNAASPTYTDITDYIEWEQPGTFLEVGNWTPDNYGRTGRTNTEAEHRIANDTGPARIQLTRSTAMSIANGGGGTQITWGTSETYVRHFAGSFKGATDDIITIPTGMGGDYLVTLSGEFPANATGTRQIWVTIGSNTASGELTGIYQSRPAQGTLPDRLTASGVVALSDGATLTATAYQNSGGALNLTDMRFSAVRIGALV